MFAPNSSRGVVTLSWGTLAGAVAGAMDNPLMTKPVSSIEVKWGTLVVIAEDLRSLGNSFVAVIKPVRQQGILFISTASSRGDAMLNDVLHGVTEPVELL